MTVHAARRRAQRAFTLVELMIVVVILGILAAVAIPAFTRYVRKSKTAEATTNIAHIVRGQITAYQRTADNDVARFISTDATPSDMPTESKYPANLALWTGDANWVALGFSLDTGHYYQYYSNGLISGPRPELLLRGEEVGPLPGDAAGFIAGAAGNLDGDDMLSNFTRSGTLNDGEIELSPLEITDELE